MTRLLDERAGIRDVALAVNQALRGRLNSVGTLTLDADVTSTVIDNALCTELSVVVLQAQSANAAAAIATTYVEAGDRQFTAHHASDPSTDRRFGYVILGG